MLAGDGRAGQAKLLIFMLLLFKDVWLCEACCGEIRGGASAKPYLPQVFKIELRRPKALIENLCI